MPNKNKEMQRNKGTCVLYGSEDDLFTDKMFELAKIRQSQLRNGQMRSEVGRGKLQQRPRDQAGHHRQPVLLQADKNSAETNKDEVWRRLEGFQGGAEEQTVWLHRRVLHVKVAERVNKKRLFRATVSCRSRATKFLLVAIGKDG